MHSLHNLQLKKISLVSYKNVRLGILLNSFVPNKDRLRNVRTAVLFN